MLDLRSGAEVFRLLSAAAGGGESVRIDESGFRLLC